MKAAIDEDLNQRYVKPSLILLMNTASYLDPRFNFLTHLSRDCNDDAITHVQDEVCELMETNSNVNADSLMRVKLLKYHMLKILWML